MPLALLFAAFFAQQATPVDSFFVIHCDTQNADDTHFQGLRDLVRDAEADKVVLSLEFGADWVPLILADATKVSDLQTWVGNGHAIGAHHHGTSHPYWDGYTDRSSHTGLAAYRGTMADFRALLDTLVQAVGSGGELAFGGIDDSETEWPWGVAWQTEGGLTPSMAVSVPSRAVRNRYGVWTVGYSYFSSPSQLNVFTTLHDNAVSPEVFGLVTHVEDYLLNRSMVRAWFAHLASGDPTGQHNLTVPDILNGSPQPLTASPSSFAAANGAAIDLDLATDAVLAGVSYRFLFSVSGAEPGFDHGGLYDDGVHIGLNLDSWTTYSYQQANGPGLSGFLGVLDSAGAASGTLDTRGPLSPAAVGMEITAVAVAFQGSQVEFSSPPVAIGIH